MVKFSVYLNRNVFVVLTGRMSLNLKARFLDSALSALWIVKGAKFLLADNERLWSDWAEAQSDLSFRWTHVSDCTFLILRLIYFYDTGFSESYWEHMFLWHWFFIISLRTYVFVTLIHQNFNENICFYDTDSSEFHWEHIFYDTDSS